MILRRLLVVAALSPGFAAALPLAPKKPEPPRSAEPIPMMPKAFLEKDFRAEERQWEERCLLEPAKKKWQGQPWADEAAKLIQEAFVIQEAEYAIIPGNLGGLAPRFRALLEKAGNDPLICLVAGKALLDEHGNRRDGQPAFDRLLNGGGSVLGILESQALQILISQHEIYDHPPADEGERLMAANLRAITDGSFDAAAEAVFVRHQIQAMGRDNLQTIDKLQRWQKAIHDSQWAEWVKLTLEGWGEVEIAWLERSSSWADNVTPEQWKGFADHLKIAHDLLGKSNRLRPDRPEAASKMIAVAMGESVDISQIRAWFDRAVSAQFDYAPAYTSLLWAYRPRWHGSHELMLAFGKECAETKRYDTLVPSRLMTACLEVNVDVEKPVAVFRHPSVKDALCEMSEGYLAAQDTPPQTRQMRASNAAMCTWLANNDALALRALKEAGGHLHHATVKYLNSMLMHEDMLRLEASADAGVFGEAIRAATNPAVRPTGQDGMKAMADALAKVPEEGLSAEAKNYLEEGRDLIGFEAALATGKWIPLKPRPGLTNFYQNGSTWAVEPDGALVATGDDTTWAECAFRMAIKTDIEMRGEITFEVPESATAVATYGFGPMLHWLPVSVGHNAGGARFVVFHDSPTSGCVQIFSHTFSKSPPIVRLKLEPKNTFKARVLDKKLSFEINGRPTNTQVSQEGIEMENHGGFIGFTAFRLPFGAKARVTNIEVRKIDAATVAAEAKATLPAKAVSKSGGPIVSAAPSSGGSNKLYWQLGLLGVALLLAALVHKFVKPYEG